MAVLIFGFFIIFGEEEARLPMLMVLVGLLIILSFFAFYMPKYYLKANLKGDGQVFLGKHSAYINGFFHLWDFPLSKIERAEEIEKPFYGIVIVYSYQTIFFKNYQELFIPLPQKVNAQEVISSLNPMFKKIYP